MEQDTKQITQGCYAVIFTSRLNDPAPGYEEMAARMVKLAQSMPGFLGLESARGPDGLGITVSWWRSKEDIVRWKAHPEHRKAQQLGKSRWYAGYDLRICKVERISVKD